MQQDVQRRRWLSALSQPLRIRGRVLPNRVMMSALTLQYGEDGLISDRHVAFYAERARGGVGLMFSEQLDASPLSPSPFAHALRAYDRRQVVRFRNVADAVHPHGAKFFAQLFCAGAAGASTVGLERWAPVRGPSSIPAPGGEVPLPLSEAELERIAADFARSAQQVVEGGLDGVEIHGAHGWLVGQFLSPYYNHRQDAWGGNVENRCRLALRIGQSIRAAVGEDLPVGIALTTDELMGPAGITEDDTLAQLEVLAAPGLFDFFNLSVGSSHQQHFTIASMAVPQGFTLPFAARAKAALGSRAAVFISGRITDAAMAGQAVATGQADVIGMTRALIADPHLPARAQGHAAPAALRCIGANHCVSRALADQAVTCVLNPAAGRELIWQSLSPVAQGLQIRVIGAGPAGLSFAVTAARLGHAVEVFEAGADPGGHLRWLAALPTRSAWRQAIDDLCRSLQEAGGRLHLERELDETAALAGEADVIVIATGSAWVLPAEPAVPPDGGGMRCLSLDQAIAQAARKDLTPFGRHVLIMDGTGTYAPLGLADLLSNAGIQVTLATEQRCVGTVAAMELDLPHVLPRLAQRGVTMHAERRLGRIQSHAVRLEGIWDQAPIGIEAVDCLVFAAQRQPESRLYERIRNLHPHVLCIGDALSPRSTAAVIHEGVNTARELVSRTGEGT